MPDGFLGKDSSLLGPLRGRVILSPMRVSGAGGPKCRDRKQAKSDADTFNGIAKITGTYLNAGNTGTSRKAGENQEENHENIRRLDKD